MQPTRILSDFIYGLILPVRATRWIAGDLRLALLSLLPIALTLVLYGYLWTILIGLLDQNVAQIFMSWGWDPHGWGAGAFLWFARIMLVITGAWAFSFFAALVALPFLDFLAERAESVVSPPLEPVPSTGWGTRIRWLIRDAVKSLILIGLALLNVLLSWVPVLNFIAFGMTCLLITLQYLSYPQSRRGQGFIESVHFVFRELPACLGFGLGLSLLFAIPILSALTLPLAVVGGTALYSRAQAERKNLPI